MIANELRIGNFITANGMNVYWPIEGIEIISSNISTQSLIYSHNSWRDLSSFEPIPLTEEWLLNFGFVHDNNLDLYYLKGVQFISLCQNITKEYWCDYESYYGLNIEIKYVHQLQNLYFDLTGQELTII
jgi:hypothetical protein